MQTVSANYRSASTTVTGIFFIVATVSAMVGATLYNPVLYGSNYLVAGAEHANRIIGGALSEIITACANIGTAIMLYPHLRKFNESVGMGYVVFRFLEVVFIVIGVVSMLSLVTVSKTSVTGIVDMDSARAVGETLRFSYRWAFILGPNFILGINTFLYSYSFLKTGLVPKWVAVYGLIGACLIFSAGILLMFDVIQLSSATHVLMAIPIATFEMVLAGRMIMIGVYQTAMVQTR